MDTQESFPQLSTILEGSFGPIDEVGISSYL